MALGVTVSQVYSLAGEEGQFSRFLPIMEATEALLRAHVASLTGGGLGKTSREPD